MNDLQLYVGLVVKTAIVVIFRCFFAYDATELLHTGHTFNALIFPYLTCHRTYCGVIAVAVAVAMVDTREFRKWRRQRQRDKLMIWLVKWAKIIALVAFWCNFLTQSAKRWREIFISEVNVVTTTQARFSKSCILCLYMKTIRAKQAKVQFAYFIQCHVSHVIQVSHWHEIIANT